MRRLRLKPALAKNGSLSPRKDQYRFSRAPACYHATSGHLSDSVPDNKTGARIFAEEGQDMFNRPVFFAEIQNRADTKRGFREKRVSGVLPGAEKKGRQCANTAFPVKAVEKTGLFCWFSCRSFCRCFFCCRCCFFCCRCCFLSCRCCFLSCRCCLFGSRSFGRCRSFSFSTAYEGH